MNFLCSNTEEMQLISEIGNRAWEKFGSHSGLPIYKDPMEPCVDISLVHLNGCKLDLKNLLKATDFDFERDIFGIFKHVCRGRCILIGYVPIFALGRH